MSSADEPGSNFRGRGTAAFRAIMTESRHSPSSSVANAHGHRGGQPPDRSKGYEEVRYLVNAWSQHRDSPFYGRPLDVRPDGRPDIVKILITIFSRIGALPLFWMCGDMDKTRWARVKCNGAAVLWGLFHLHMRMCASGVQKVDNYRLFCLLSSIESVDLARVFEKGDEAGYDDILEIMQGNSTLRPDQRTFEKDDWLEKVKLAVRPFEKTDWSKLWDKLYPSTSGHAEDSPFAMPFRQHAMCDFKSALLIAKTVTRWVCVPNNAPLDDHIYHADGPNPNLQEFAQCVAERVDDVPRTKNRFFLFCDALFVRVASCYNPSSHSFPWTTDFNGREFSTPATLAVIGMRAGAAAFLHMHYPILVATLNANQTSILPNLPSEITEHLLTNHLIAGAFADYKTLPSNKIRQALMRQGLILSGNPVNENMERLIAEKRIPHAGQKITFGIFDDCMDMALIPPFKDHILHLLHHPGSTGYSSTPFALKKLVEHAEALKIVEPGFTRRNSLETCANEFNRIRDETLGMRHTLQYLQRSNYIVCKLRAVCKSYAEFFKDYVFRPYVEAWDSCPENGHQADPARLRGAPPRTVLLTTKPHQLHVFFARKTITVDANTSEITERWQYVNPSLICIGCNAVVVTCETEPDEDGHVIRFNSEQGRAQNRSFVRETNQQQWNPINRADIHHVRAESLSSESIYSIHPGTRWVERCLSQRCRLVNVWDHKFAPYFKDPWNMSLALAHTQSLTLTQRCKRTSASFCASKNAPLRAIRFRVAFGTVPRTPKNKDLIAKSLRETIVPFEDDEMQHFQTYLSATSDYFYASAVSLRSEEVEQRSKKRKLRTEKERLERQSAAAR